MEEDKVEISLRKNLFTSENQPSKKGRMKTTQMAKLMRAFGKAKAPGHIISQPMIQHFMMTNGLKGSMNEAVVARLYAIALEGNNKEAVKAIQLIVNFFNDPKANAGQQVIINFVAPPSSDTNTIDLTNDSFTVMPQPGESKAD